MVARLALQEHRLHVKTTCGVALELPVEELVSADYSFGKLVYLSDLKPLSVQWTPRVGLPAAATMIRHYGEPRNNAPFGRPDSGLPGLEWSDSKQADPGLAGNGIAVENSPLTLRWQSAHGVGNDELKAYAKGLAIRSRTKLVYRLPKGMRIFHAIAGIDPATSSQGNVTLKLAGDRGGFWEGAIDGNHRPVRIDLDLQDSRQLTILVDYGKNLDWGDRLHLVDARVTR